MSTTTQVRQSVKSVTKISASQDSVKFNDAKSVGGSNWASSTEAVMDRNFIAGNRYSWFWVSSKNAPKQTGEYQVDRENNKINKISRETYNTLPWDERLYVYESAIEAANEGRPLALLVDYDLFVRGGLVLGGDYGRDLAARVALASRAQAGSEAAAPKSPKITAEQLVALQRKASVAHEELAGVEHTLPTTREIIEALRIKA